MGPMLYILYYANGNEMADVVQRKDNGVILAWMGDDKAHPTAFHFPYWEPEPLDPVKIHIGADVLEDRTSYR